MFPGRDNNDMLWLIQEVRVRVFTCDLLHALLLSWLQLKGPFPKKLIRRHFVACEALEVLEPSFDPGTHQFRRNVKDPVSGAPSLKLETVIKPSEDLMTILTSNMSPGDDKFVFRYLRMLLL